MVKKIKIYTTPICMECEKAKRFFKEKGIKYDEIDIFDDKEKGEDALKKSGQKRIPVIEIDGKFFSGFDKKQIEELL